MAFSYSGNPADSKLDYCRFMVGDTDIEEQIMHDEEIQFLIATYSTDDNALMYNLFARAATVFARDIKRSLGPQSQDPTERLKFFKSQADMYKKKTTSAGMSVPVYNHPKVFSIGMQNNPPWPKAGE